MKYVKSIQVRGNLKTSSELNFERLTSEFYLPKNFIQDSEYSWPGDFEGRTLLAIILLCRVFGTKHDSFAERIELIKKSVNSGGYFGTIFNGKEVNEQQLSGNSWFFRAITEYYYDTKDEFALNLIKNATESYLLKIEPFIDRYPIDPAARANPNKGEAIGALHKEPLDGWRLSTDTGCVFISLDGITSVYKVTKDERLKALIEKMIAKFDSIDKVGLCCQTHATLSATRGILNYYELSHDEKYLQIAIDTYEKYKKHGMTVNYANYNWFNRPEWTEPCGIIDSLIIASRLFTHTKNGEYAKDINRIYYNALMFSQRSNGGFGCDTCLTEENPLLEVNKNFYEAYWCCTMRGAEGLYELCQLQYLEDKNRIYIPFYNSNTAVLLDGAVKITQITDYPYNNSIELNIENSIEDIELYLYVPQHAVSVQVNGQKHTAQNEFIVLRGKLCGKYEIIIENYVMSIAHKTKSAYYYGDLLLCEIINGGNNIKNLSSFTGNQGQKLLPIINMKNVPKDEAIKLKLKCLF